MMTSELISMNALLMANVLLLGAAALELLRVKRIVARHGRTARRGGEGVDGGNERLLGAVDERILALRSIADELARKAIANPPQDRSGTPFDEAVRLAGSGADAEELRRLCGLNRGEAELMHRLHARRVS